MGMPVCRDACQRGSSGVLLGRWPELSMAARAHFQTESGDNMDSRTLGSRDRTSCSLITTVCWFIILFNVLPSAAREVAPPDTPAGQALASWLEAFNSADETLPKAYIEKYQPAYPVCLQMSFRQRTGGLDLTGIHISEPLHIEFLAKERASGTRGTGELMLS
jgi:hypothetical protein